MAILGLAAVAVVVVAGVVLRFVTDSALWLDEALSVNLAELSVGDIGDALRHDGHPPLYYWLLHGWTAVFGTGDVAVRALSGVAAVATLPLAYAAGRRVGGNRAGVAALVLTAASPFAIRYATEARMYALVMLAVTAGYLAVRRALDRPSAGRVALVVVLSGAVCWLHYWGVYLAGATAVVLLVARAAHHVHRRAGLVTALASAAGPLTLLPWLPSLVYQLRHTGTPWATRTRPTTAVAITVDDLGGLLSDAHLLGAFVLLLVAIGLFVAPTVGRPDELRFEPRTVPGVRGEIAVAALTLAVGISVVFLTGGGYQSRYAATIVPLILIAAAGGVARLPRVGERAVALGMATALAVPGAAANVVTDRSQSGVVVAALNANAAPGDVVVFCPDQLGPAFSRGLRDDVETRVYPTGAAPEFVDWTDYEARNAAADPAVFAQGTLEAATGRTLWLVWASGYRTLGVDCELVASEFEAARPAPNQVVTDNGGAFYEHAWLTRFQAQG